MNNYGLAVTIAVFVALIIVISTGLKYSKATLLFGLIAVLSAPVVLHNIPNVSWALGMLMVLSLPAFHLRSSYK